MLEEQRHEVSEWDRFGNSHEHYHDILGREDNLPFEARLGIRNQQGVWIGPCRERIPWSAMGNRPILIVFPPVKRFYHLILTGSQS